MEKYLLAFNTNNSTEMSQIVERLEYYQIPVIVEHINSSKSLGTKNSSNSFNILVAQEYFQNALIVISRLRQNIDNEAETFQRSEQEFQIIH